MLNCSASLAVSTSVLKALPGKLDVKRRSSSILYVCTVESLLYLDFYELGDEHLCGMIHKG